MWRLGVVAVLGVIAWAFSGDKKIFVTYDYDNDRNYKNLLVAWAKNAAFDLSFNDKSVDISVNSDDLGAIRRVVSARIKESSCVLCVVGEHTWKSKWVEWELQKARELGKPLVAVKTAKSNQAPADLVNVGASWALAFKFDSIKKAIEKVG